MWLSLREGEKNQPLGASLRFPHGNRTLARTG